MKRRNLELVDAVKQSQFFGAKVVYSPAHIEEIVNIYRTEESDEDCDRYIREHLEFLASLTDCWEFLPSESGSAGPGRLKQEHPAVCLKRVIDLYELTYFAEGNETVLREYIPQSNSVPAPIDAFKDENVLKIFKNRLFLRGHREEELPYGAKLRDSHSKTAAIIDICFRSLHDAGFGLEKKSKTRSSIRDVTHAIYGTMADIFVSGDTRMLAKLKASYKLLKADCIPMNPEEFVAYVCRNAAKA